MQLKDENNAKVVWAFSEEKKIIWFYIFRSVVSKNCCFNSGVSTLSLTKVPLNSKPKL